MGDFSDLATSLLDELAGALRSVNDEDVDALGRAILQARRVFVAGQGRSGLQMRAFAMRLMHLGLPVHVVGDVTTPAVGAGDLLIIGSGSGRTPSLVQYGGRAKALRGRVALITAARSSPIAEQADHVVRIAALSPKLEGVENADDASAQPLGSLFDKALGAVLDIAVVQLMDDLDVSAGQMFARHANLE